MCVVGGGGAVVIGGVVLDVAESSYPGDNSLLSSYKQ